MTEIDRKPFWTQQKAWEASEEKAMRLFKFENADKVKSEVIADDGTNGIEFFIAITLPQFNRACDEQNWEEAERYEQFTKVLGGDMRTTWEEVLESGTYSRERNRTANAWPKAVDALICKFLNCKKPRDVQLRWIENGYNKPPLHTAENHFRRFKEIIRHTKVLPKGVKADPSAAELKAWYFGTYCRAHRSSFLSAGKELDDNSLEQITEFMRLQQEKDQNNGTLDKLMKSKASRRDGSKNRDGRHDKPYRRSSHYRDDSPDYARYKDGKKRSRGSRGDRDKRGRDRSREDKRKKYDKKSGRRQDDKKSPFMREDGKDCGRHFPCKHTWEECWDNPMNQKKKVSFKKEHASHYQSDASSSVSKNGSSSNDSNSDSSNDSSSGPEEGEENGDQSYLADTGSMENMESRIPRHKRLQKLKEKLGKATPKDKKKKAVPQKAKKKLVIEDTSDEDDELAGSK